MLETTQFMRVSTVECGTVLSNVVTITAEDLESPVFTLCPEDLDLEVERNKSDTLLVSQNPVFSDNCGVVKLTWTMSGATNAVSPH